MGRPLWKAHVSAVKHVFSQQEAVSGLAASKLLSGLYIKEDKNYHESTMYGAEALFCRLGLRPHSISELSTRVVADFMGVLHYVSFTNDTHITGYPSEPVLAFGAARLWYQLEQVADPQKLTALEKYLLPCFQNMIMQRVIDIDDVGQVAARIFSLLATDAVVMSKSKPARENIIFAGQFCTVREFLDILSGPPGDNYHMLRNYELYDVPNEVETHKAWMAKWKDWKIGFSQFVDLPDEPTEETLWQLLSHRGAGVFWKGSKIVIPIFSSKVVSFILIKVSNQDEDKEFPSSASYKLFPSYVFHHSNSLSKMESHDTIPIYIGPREEITEMNPAQLYMNTTESSKKEKDENERGDKTNHTVYAVSPGRVSAMGRFC